MSFSATAFEGQPKEILAMPNFGTKMTISFEGLQPSDLKQEKFNCRESSCNVLATLDTDVMARVGDVEWRAKFARVNVAQGGEIMTPFKATVIIFEELETGNRLTMAINENTDEFRTLCFGKIGNSGRNCTTYKVLESH